MEAHRRLEQKTLAVWSLIWQKLVRLLSAQNLSLKDSEYGSG